jgi:CheY-like chemotaxis protein
VASDGAEAVDMVEQIPYDLVLMDCHMPEMDGYTATRHIRDGEAGTTRHVPIIAMTANVMREDRARCLACGMDGFIPKPIMIDDLDSVLACWIQGPDESLGAGPDELTTTGTHETTDAPGAVDLSVLETLRTLRDDGDRFVRGLADTFLADTATRLATARAALLAHDADGLERAAHGVKGSSANLGAARLSAACGSLVLAARGRAWDDAPALLDRVEAEFAAARVVFDALVSGHEAPRGIGAYQ